MGVLSVDKGTIAGMARKISTGSIVFDAMLGGGLSTCCITDVFGAAATGKTQFAFQNAMQVARSSLPDSSVNRPAVVFVDCAGSFRPERIAEMAEARNELGSEVGEKKQRQPVSQILSRISSVYVRSVAEQREVCDLLLTSDHFKGCKLLVIDDVTTNFVAEYSGLDVEPDKLQEGADVPSETKDRTPDFVGRYFELARYGRKLALIALKMNLSVLLTNSIRTRFPSGENQVVQSDGAEVETTGSILSQFSLFRIHFSRRGNDRGAKLLSPALRPLNSEFKIVKQGIVP